MKTIPIDLLQKTFELREGHLYWRGKKQGRRLDRPVGTTSKRGYRIVNFRKTLYPVHRIIFAIANGRWPTNQIDHINLNKSDNRPENLREATNAENSYNHGLRSNNTSGRKGVVWYKGRWLATIRVHGHQKWLGLHDDIDLAAFIYECAARKYHGVFANV